MADKLFPKVKKVAVPEVVEVLPVKDVKKPLIASEPEVVEVAAAISLRPNAGNQGGRIPCEHCNQLGHAKATCWSLYPNLRPQRSFNRQASVVTTDNRRCFSCNQVGHLANACPQRQRPQFGNNNNAPNFNVQRSAQNIAPAASAQFSSSNLTCLGCGASGANFHFWKDCPAVQQRQVNNNTVVTIDETDHSLN
ncbi:unnamed protein product [Rotaria magnacalcarata]|nr:unnamed protein product [Rotaria magnacalcarata]